MSAHGAVAIGVATMTTDGTVLDVWYPEPQLGAAETSGHSFLDGDEIPEDLRDIIRVDPQREVELKAVEVTIADLTEAPIDAMDVYLRLHLISHRLIPPHYANLEGQFGLLSNVVWTNHGSCKVEGFDKTRAKLQARGPVIVYGIDKFPRMVDFVVPSGVRIGDADRVRLGAHLADLRAAPDPRAAITVGAPPEDWLEASWRLAPRPEPEAVELGAADADEMLDLIARTRPGPFEARTHEMGRYVGSDGTDS